MRKQRYVGLMGLIGLLILGSLNPVIAVGDWSDDFDDGNYDGWTVTGGSFTVTDGQLVVSELVIGDFPAFMDHTSNVTMGTWSFDMTIVDTVDSEDLWVYFMKDEPGYFTGVSLSLELWGTIVALGRASGTSFTEFDRWNFPDSKFGQHHFDIIHNETGYFYVYINGSLVIETSGIVPDLTYDYFSFGGSLETSFDNLVVTEYVEPIPTTTTPPDTTSTTTTTGDTTTPPAPTDMTTVLLIAGGGIAAVVVIVIIVKMRS